MLGYRLKIEPALLDKLKVCAEASGYATVDEFITHTLEKEVQRLAMPEDGESADVVKKRLQGLGYLD
jgi:hypothetical protein